MKHFFFTIIAFIATISLNAQTKVPYIIAERYFLRNDAQPVFDADGTVRDYFFIDSKEELERNFGYATVMGPKGTPTKIDYTKQFAIALFVTTAEKITNLTVKSLTKKGKDLLLTYEIVTAEKATETSKAFKILIIDKKYGGPVKTIKKTKSALSDSVYIKTQSGQTYAYKRKIFNFISTYFTDLFKQEITSPAKTYNDRYQPNYDNPKAGSALASLKANDIYFTARNGWSEFCDLYAYFLKHINGVEKYQQIREQLYNLYDASLSIDVSLGANGTFTSDIDNALEAYVEYDISQKFIEANYDAAKDAVDITQQKTDYISERNAQIEKFVNTKYEKGFEPYNLKEQAESATKNLAKLTTGINKLSVLQALQAFDTKFRQPK